MSFIVMTIGVFSVAVAAAILTYLVHFFMMTVDVFFYAEAGAHFIDSPYAFPHCNIL
jgi:hypothetical protein